MLLQWIFMKICARDWNDVLLMQCTSASYVGIAWDHPQFTLQNDKAVLMQLAPQNELIVQVYVVLYQNLHTIDFVAIPSIHIPSTTNLSTIHHN